MIESKLRLQKGAKLCFFEMNHLKISHDFIQLLQ